MNFGNYDPVYYYMWTINPNFPIPFGNNDFRFMNSNNIDFNHFYPTAPEQEKSKNQNSLAPKNQQPCFKRKKDLRKIDDDYQLEKQKKQEILITQKQGRNVISNILRSFFKYLSTSSSSSLIAEISKSGSSSLAKKDLLQWFDDNGIHYRNYIRVSSITKMLNESDSQKVKLFRHLLDHYLEHKARLHFLNSQKLKTKNKLMTLQQIRILKQQFKETTNEQ